MYAKCTAAFFLLPPAGCRWSSLTLSGSADVGPFADVPRKTDGVAYANFEHAIMGQINDVRRRVWL